MERHRKELQDSGKNIGFCATPSASGKTVQLALFQKLAGLGFQFLKNPLDLEGFIMEIHCSTNYMRNYPTEY
jgi:hypothetical protein